MKNALSVRYTGRMAREESTREDLLREATALVERIELILPGSAALSESDDAASSRVVAGFRADGALSVFFGEDPVYQFNAAAELRRAYCGGLLFKAVRGRLASLERVRHQNQVDLVRRDLSETQQAEFIRQMADRLHELAHQLDAKRFEVAGQVPRNADVLGRLRTWLASHRSWHVATRPNA